MKNDDPLVKNGHTRPAEELAFSIYVVALSMIAGLAEWLIFG